MPDSLTTPVPVLKVHLLDLERLLLNVRGYFEAKDIARAYATNTSAARPSPITKQVNEQLARLSGYLAEEDDEPDEPVS